MSPSGITWFIAGGLVLLAALIIGIVLWSDLAYRRDDIAPTMPSPAPRRTDSVARPQQNAWRPLWTHAAPPRPFTVPKAHEVMREHRGCLAADCPRKRAAHGALVAAGVLVPRRRRVIVR